MALFTLTGRTLPETKTPTAFATATPEYGVVGSVVTLDARNSTDPDGLSLTYEWKFTGIPIGSKVVQEGFRKLEADNALVSFSPDVVGQYEISLRVSNGSQSSEQVLSPISIQAILVPHARGLVPDGKFIWSYIRDVWQQVEGREWFETLWSTLIQITGSELLKLYQVDFNKSIRDIQPQFQRRWLKFSPELSLDDRNLSFFLGNHCAGMDASTDVVGLEGEAILLSNKELILVEGTVFPDVSKETLEIYYSTDGRVNGSYKMAAVNANGSGYRLPSNKVLPPSWASERVVSGKEIGFIAGSKTWSTNLLTAGERAAIRIGDIVYLASGPNAGTYRVLSKGANSIQVDRAPIVASSSANKADIYHPVGIRVSQTGIQLGDTVSVAYQEGQNDLSKVAPGRLLVVGDQAFTILRTLVDARQRIPTTVVTVDRDDVPAGLRSLPWRTPHTIVSKTQDFTALGVTPGDLLLADLTDSQTETAVEIRLRVVGVDRNRVGVVLTDQEVGEGELPQVPYETYLQISEGFNIPESSKKADGTVVLAGLALDMLRSAMSGSFARTYFNKPLTPDTDLTVAGRKFKLRPKSILRNKRIPVPDELVSVPALQEWIVQPTVMERDGKVYQVHKGKEYELARRPTILIENTHYLVDGEFAIDGYVSLSTGSRVVHIEDGDFLDRNIAQGDELIIDEPAALEGSYFVAKVLGSKDLLLTRPIPRSPVSEFVTARVRLRRRNGGKFIRFAPSVSDASSSLPPHLWADVSFFDNSKSIEDNFGILVGLNKKDFDTISLGSSYRQAVAGLMYAYTQGSALDKVRLGAQILLGLPFAETKGIIRSIENDYRLDLVTSKPILGRILIEDLGTDGTPAGMMRIYTYPVDVESTELSGIETNPETKKPYAVGDVVEAFAPLCKGVKVFDYISEPGQIPPSTISQLQQFHTVRLVSNDRIFGVEELDLVSKFLRRITPSYVSFVMVSKSEFVDEVQVNDDRLRLKIGVGNGVLVDNTSLMIPTPIMYDARGLSTPTLLQTDDGVLVQTEEGLKRISGLLASGTGAETVGTDTITIPEDLRKKFVAPGDWVILQSGTGPDSRRVITEVNSGSIRVLSGRYEGSGLRYQIWRPAFIESPSVDSYDVLGDGTNHVALDPVLAALSDIGDELILENGRVILILDPKNGYVTPPLPAGSFSARLKKRNSSGPIGWDHVEKFSPADEVYVALASKPGKATAAVSSKKVLLDADMVGLNVLPGDLLQLLGGANASVDIGYGPGVYPVVKVYPDGVDVSVALSASGSHSFKVIRRR